MSYFKRPMGDDEIEMPPVFVRKPDKPPGDVIGAVTSAFSDLFSGITNPIKGVGTAITPSGGAITPSQPKPKSSTGLSNIQMLAGIGVVGIAAFLLLRRKK